MNDEKSVDSDGRDRATVDLSPPNVRGVRGGVPSETKKTKEENAEKPMKQAAKPKPIITEPRLLVLHEKHGDRFFYLENDAQLFKAALKVLAERWNEGCWYYRPDEPGGTLDFTKDDVCKMPESMRASAENTLRIFATRQKQYKADLADYAPIEKAVKEKDGRLAWQCLRSREDYEYEGFSFERLEDLDDG